MIIQIKYELLQELLEAGGQAAQVQLLAPTHQLQHLNPQLLVALAPLLLLICGMRRPDWGCC